MNANDMSSVGKEKVMGESNMDHPINKLRNRTPKKWMKKESAKPKQPMSSPMPMRRPFMPNADRGEY